MNALALHSAVGSSTASPTETKTRGGATYQFQDEVWCIREGVTQVSFNFRRVSDLISPELLAALKSSLVWLLANRAPTTVHNAFMCFEHMLRLNGRTSSELLTEVTSADVISYRAALGEREVNRLHTLATLLRQWRALEIGGVAKSAIEFLDALRMKSPPPGEPVRTMCPHRGPLTALEDEAFQASLNAAFAEGRLDADEFFASWLSRALGQRPAQTAALKISDLLIQKSPDGSMDFMIRIPRAKKRYLTHPREALKVRPLLRQIAEPLHAYLETVANKLRGQLEDPSLAPMFPRPRAGAILTPGYEWHRTANDMSALIAGAARKLNAHSERTGQALRVSASRLRRTVGTRAAEEGHGERVIAEILDHADATSARYYVEATPAIIARIDSSVAHAMAPLARAFQGLQPASPGDFEGPSGDQILDLRIDQTGKAMGQCHGTSCQFNAPIACYTCRAFRPWIDGPHQAVLTDLLARRDAQLETTSSRIAAVNDRTILAVSEVIQICEKLSAEKSHA